MEVRYGQPPPLANFRFSFPSGRRLRVNIISAYPGGYYGIVSGTSFSAPIVAAEAALIRSLKMKGIQNSIAGGVVNISTQNPGYTGMLGYGRVNILSAVRR